MARVVKGIWIPIEIWENKDLTWNEKILLMEIDSFTSKGVDCYFSDEYIAEKLGVYLTTANKILSSLIKKGYVIKTRNDGRRRFVQSCMAEQGRLALNDKSDLHQTATQTCTKQQVYRINNINKQDYQTNNNNNREVFNVPSLEEVEAYCRERANGIKAQDFLDYYESNGWMVGRVKMKNWKAAVRTWETRRHDNNGNERNSAPRRGLKVDSGEITAEDYPTSL